MNLEHPDPCWIGIDPGLPLCHGEHLLVLLGHPLRKHGASRGTEDLRRRAVIVLSDGEDTSSLVSYDEVLELAKRSETAIYAIGIPVMATVSHMTIWHAVTVSAIYLPGDLIKVAVSTVVTAGVLRGYPSVMPPTRRGSTTPLTTGTTPGKDA